MVAVIIALLVGSSAPWWWDYLLNRQAQTHEDPPNGGTIIGTESSRPPKHEKSIDQELGLFATGKLVLRDWFSKDNGWELPKKSEYSSEIGGGKFLAELTKPLSAGFGTAWRSLPQSLPDDFMIEVSATTKESAGFGLCWTSLDGSIIYRYYIYHWPDQPQGGYLLSKMESWEEAIPGGGKGRYGGSVNVLRPADKQMSAIRSEMVRQKNSGCTIAAICSGSTVKLYYNGQLLDQGQYTPISVKKVGIFISGESRVEFRDFAVRRR